MLAGSIYYGAMYGGSTTSILVNIPGEAASVVTCLDGHKMALKGRAGPALGIAAFGSFIAGTFGVIALSITGPVLSGVALRFGPPEYFAMMIVGITVLTYLSSGSMVKSLMMAAVGLILGGVGMDAISGKYRFTYGIQVLSDGVGLVPLVMGLFGISEVLENLETEIKRDIVSAKFKNLLPNLQDWKDSTGPIARGTFLGFFMGLVPGGGAIIASFASYAIEKKMAKHPEEFGHGAIQGVAGPEAANNAAASGNFIPLLTLGTPWQCGHGYLAGRTDDPWIAAGAASDDEGSRHLLGDHCQHVLWQCDAAGSEPPADRPLGAGIKSPLLPALSLDPALLLDWRL